VGKPLRIHLLAQIVAITLACSVGGFIALVSFGAIGGTAIGVAPQFAFGLVEGYVCPEESRLAISSIRRSYHRPGEAEPVVECVAPDGTRQDVVGQSIVAVLALAFLIVFVPTIVVIGVPLAVIAFLLSWAVLRNRNDPASVR